MGRVIDHTAYLMTIRRLADRRGVSVYLVGGFLRDAVLGRASMDMDFAVERRAVAFARSFARSIRGAFVLLDEERGCARVVKKHEGRIATFDFADFRAASFREDLRHRDFTINTLAVCVNDLTAPESFLDRRMDGRVARADLENRTIRMVTALVFQEDPLRLLRAFSLRAQLGFRIEAKTRRQIRADRGLLRQVSPERVREEFFKVLSAPRAGEILKAMHSLGLLEQVLVQTRIMFGVHQGGYHHLDVWRHSLESVVTCDRLIREAVRDPDMAAYLNEPVAGDRRRAAILRLACLLHDIGKPDTRRREGERMSFHGHEHVGAKITGYIARDLRLSLRERRMLADMVRGHLRPGYLSNFKRPSERAFFRYFRDTGAEAVSIALLALADQRATRGPMTTAEDQRHHEAICRELIERYFSAQRQPVIRPLINGHDLITALKLKPSPLFKEILSAVEEAQALGRVRDREGALCLARDIAVDRSSATNKGRADARTKR